jgi:hypothetical protein
MLALFRSSGNNPAPSALADISGIQAIPADNKAVSDKNA